MNKLRFWLAAKILGRLSFMYNMHIDVFRDTCAFETLHSDGEFRNCHINGNGYTKYIFKG